jgi:hypothetical protein
MPLIKINIFKDNKAVDCAWMCITIECREMKLDAPIFYGYTQEDINNNLKE